jgi:DNA-binding response OmpR family regulator
MKIIIFDDDRAILAISRIILEEKGWEVYTYEDCNAIVANVERLRPNLVLIDNQIPGMGGVEATRLLKQNPDLAHIPVIYFSAHHDIEKLAGEAGADSYLCKPLDLDAFEKAIHGMVKSK